jgi:Leucine-rich repeat (LRR) protein
MIRSPFKFLDPFGPQDNKVFFGRSAEIDELYAQVFRTPLLLVYGLTGTGKTSLIDCGLRNRFDGTDWLPFYVRRKENINEALREMLRKAQPDDKDRDLPETVAYLYRYFLRPVYLIFDQFEELFILGAKAEQEEFKQNLKKLLDANLTCKIILIMREEYIGWLYDFEREIPAIFDFRLRVETMKRKNIEEVIEKSCAAFNIGLENAEKNIEQIYDNVSEGKAVVQLPYLQVYLDTLYRGEVQRTYPQGAPHSDEQPYPPLTFTSQEITDCGLISSVLESFLREKVGELQESMAKKHPGLPADAVKTLLNTFVSALGTKRPMPYQLAGSQVQLLFPPEVLRDFGAAFIHDTLRALEQNRILRDSGETFELAHDTLAHKIHENRSEEDKRREEVQARLHTAFKEYQDSGTYLNAPQIARLEEWLPLLRLSSDESKFVDASRVDVEEKRNKERQLRLRAQNFSYIASAVAVVAIGVGIFAWTLQRKALTAEKNATDARNTAEAVLNKIYFYADRFGLAYDKDKQRYGFIDRALNTKIDFKYKEAAPFENNGYAKVRWFDNSFHLIDTSGEEYRLAFELSQLTPPNDDDSDITALDLRSKFLETIPLQVFEQAQLRILLLDNNDLTRLPPQISKLAQLQSLYLSGNKLTTLPDFPKLTQLQKLDLSYTQLTTPPDLSKLTQLQTLVLIGNQLTTPPDLSKLTQLQTLVLRSNQLTTLPDLSKLTQLQILDLSDTQLKTVPDLSKLTQLQTLDLSDNQLKTVPDLSKLTKLQILDLSYTQLKTLTDLSKLTQLQTLDLSGTQLTTLPNLSKLTQLQTLVLQGNQLKTLTDLSKLTQLQTLVLSDNQLKTLTDLSKLTQLKTLVLRDNQLTPLTDLSKLTQLQTLDLGSNGLKTLPDLSKLTQLRTLVLSGNQLKTLPDLSKLTQLQTLDLGDSQLKILPDLSKLTQLQTLYLSGNQLKTLPDLSNLTQLQTLDLIGNQLKILPDLSKLTQLQTLYLNGNQLTTLPDLSNLTKLKDLILDGNPIPESIITSLKTKMPWCNIAFNE